MCCNMELQAAYLETLASTHSDASCVTLARERIQITET